MALFRKREVARIGYSIHSSKRQESKAITKQNMDRTSVIWAKTTAKFRPIDLAQSRYSSTITLSFSNTLPDGPPSYCYLGLAEVNNFFMATFPTLESCLHFGIICVDITVSRTQSGNPH